MWPFRKTSARRKEIRRTKAERRGAWYRRVPISFGFSAASVTFATAVLAAAILVAGGPQLGYREGESVPRAITSRIDLRIEDEQLTAEKRLRARDSSPNYYKLETSLLTEIRSRLINALTLANAHAEDAEKLREAAAASGLVLDDAALAELQRLAALPANKEFTDAVDAAIAVLRNKPLIDPDSPGLVRRSAAQEIVLHDPDKARDETRLPSQILFTSDESGVRRALDDAARPFREALRASMAASIGNILRGEANTDGAPGPIRPLYRYDTTRTIAVSDKAYAEVPTQYLVYAAGDKLADAGPLTADELKLLNIEHHAYLTAMQVESPWRLRVSIASRVAFALLVVLGVIAYVSRYQPEILKNRLRRTVTALALVIVFALARLLFVGFDTPPHVAVGLQAAAAALIAIVYTHAAVFSLCGGLAILITLAMQQSVGFLLVLLAVSATFGFGLRIVRNRGKIVLVGALAGVFAMALSFAVAALAGQTYEYSLVVSLWAGATTVLAAFIIEGVLPFIERVFRLSTGMTLLEWCDANKPLMRMMAHEAPGTFNHSLLVASLAEAAAEAIGANGLLARAGAYYHDIGKINKPEYFVENQARGVSRHDRLSPAMSLLIIVGHVKDGIEMGKEYNLPESLHPFIAEHHGTTLVEYFYHAATQKRRAEDPEVSEAEFRYPGPKPQSRETAILMLCDGVEGAVRAMPEPTPNRIETVVGDIVRKRLVDGQFDECELTFRELAEIEKSLNKSLCGIYHARVAYPDKGEEKRSAAS